MGRLRIERNIDDDGFVCTEERFIKTHIVSHSLIIIVHKQLFCSCVFLYPLH